MQPCLVLFSRTINLFFPSIPEKASAHGNPNFQPEKCHLKQQEKAINSPTERPTTS
jgi:hypothetical protein